MSNDFFIVYTVRLTRGRKQVWFVGYRDAEEATAAFLRGEPLQLSYSEYEAITIPVQNVLSIKTIVAEKSRFLFFQKLWYRIVS